MSRWQQVIDDILAKIEGADPTQPRRFQILINDAIWRGGKDVADIAATKFPYERPQCVGEFLTELLEAVSQRLKTDPAAKAFQEVQRLLSTQGIRVSPFPPIQGIRVPPGPFAPIPPFWFATGNMSTPRGRHTATVLASGKVLVAGGATDSFTALATAELYDPTTGAWSPSRDSMMAPRMFHTATLLLDGKVLVAGGENHSAPSLASAELYDPNSDTWSATGDMIDPRLDHTATLLSDGRVLVVGGQNFGIVSPTAELYDPNSGTWSTTGSLVTRRQVHSATRLSNGQVLAAGGTRGDLIFLDTAELYDPPSGTWSTTGTMTTQRFSFTLTLLSNGLVLAAGGWNPASHALQTAEVYDPDTRTWSATCDLISARMTHTATLLSNGKVVIAGGSTSAGAQASVELYDPASGSYYRTFSMNNARYVHTANLVLGDQVLVAGGFDLGDGTLASAEVYVPGPDVLSMVPDVVKVRPAAAAKLVQCAGLVASFRGAQPTNFTYVASQSPIAGQLVDRGSTVTMYLVTVFGAPLPPSIEKS